MFVFDDPALIDLAQEPARPFAWPMTYLRTPRGVTHFFNLCSIRLHGVERAWPWHLENFLLHLLNFELVCLIWGRWAGLFYAFHPITGGLCLYVSARADLLMIAFGLLAVLSFDAGGWWAPLAPVCVYLARGAKHIGVPVCVFLFFLWRMF